MKLAPWMVVLLVILSSAVIRLRLLQIPLERDEGEYAYAGQLMLQGIPPYRLAANMKLPGAYAAYALIMRIFGQTIGGIHLGLLLANAASIVLVYLLGKRLFSTTASYAACASYALLSVGMNVMGTQAHATHFVILFALAGTLFLLRYFDSGAPSFLFAAGFLFGLAFMMKQQGVLFSLFAAGCLAATHWTRERGRWLRLIQKLALFTAAAATPFALTCLVLWRAGVFSRFWFEVFIYARIYAGESSLADGWGAFKANFPPIVKENPGIWLFAAAGFILIWRKRRSAAFSTAFLVFSFLAVCPGFYFRDHYFVLLLPAIALFAGAAVENRISITLFVAVLAVSLAVQRDFLFRMTPVQASRAMYGENIFPEAIPVADYIRAHSPPGARIAVIGSEPEIYFYADRHSATSYIYTYAMMEPQPYALAMQNSMIQEIEVAAPEFIVKVTGDESWLQSDDSPTRIFDWWSTYGPTHYRQVGLVEVVDGNRPVYQWDAPAGSYQPTSDHYYGVYRRTP